MKKFKGKDKLFGDVAIRQDGRVIHPMYLFEVKKPEELKYPYDYYKLVSTIPPIRRSAVADGGCALAKRGSTPLPAQGEFRSNASWVAYSDIRTICMPEASQPNFSRSPCCCPA